MSFLGVEIILTEDGSHTLFVSSLNETYHSIHGAIQESNHVFIKNGLEYLTETAQLNKVDILEIGFGTGLNTLLTYEFSVMNPEIKIEYTTLEPFPLNKEIIQGLNYHKQEDPGALQWQNIHAAGWGVMTQISDNFRILKLKNTVQNFTTDHTFDLIYFDAFAPGKQPEVWKKYIFEKLYHMMKQGAVLTTYCAQGKFKRTLKSVGFEVESLPGPPGKIEMVRASKNGQII